MDNLSRRSILWAGLSLAAGSAWAQSGTPADKVDEATAQRTQAIGQPAELIEDPRVETLDLSASGHTWRLLIGAPAVEAPPEGYSVLYVLDGNACFPMLWHAREQLAAKAPVVIVGVGYPITQRFDVVRRYWDLTPETAAEYLRMRGSAESRTTGGQAVFLDFLAQDVKQAISQRFKINPKQQTLFGHSLAGLFTLHTLFNRPALFQNYVAADPAIWWNNQSVLQEESAFRAGVSIAGGVLVSPLRLLVEKSGKAHGSHTHEETQKGIDTAKALAARLAHIKGLDVRYRDFPEHSHPSMIEPSVRDALLFHLNTLPEGVIKLSA